METKANHRNLTKVLLIGGEPDPGFLATSTKLGEHAYILIGTCL